jgi:hypothetical protein
VRKTATAPRLVLLVTAAVFINYIDRGNLATAPPLRKVPIVVSLLASGRPRLEGRKGSVKLLMASPAQERASGAFAESALGGGEPFGKGS